MSLAYFKTALSLAPKSAPGFDVGTRRSETSAGMNLSDVFRVKLSFNSKDLVIGASFSHCRLNWNGKVKLASHYLPQLHNSHLDDVFCPQYWPIAILIQQDSQILTSLELQNEALVPGRTRVVTNDFRLCLSEVMPVRVDFDANIEICWMVEADESLNLEVQVADK